MKKSYSAILAVIILIASVALVAAAVEYVTNGDFAAGLTGWTTDSGTPAVPGDCDPGQANLDTTGNQTQEAISQCISPLPAGNNWFMSADILWDGGFSTGLFVSFYDGADCTGTNLQTESVGPQTQNSALETFSQTFSYDSSGASSAKVVAIVQRSGQQGGPQANACYDNISFSDVDATAVTLGNVGAQSPAVSPWLIVMIAAVLVILTASALLLRQRAAVRSE